MGFGTFFIGYFLLLDVAYYLITDVIAAAIMALGLSKLAPLNRGFKAALFSSIAFLVFALAEFGYGAYEMLFSPPENALLISYGAIIRCVLICLLTLTSLEGMREVAAEVGLNYLSKKCKISAYLSLPIYIFAIIAETPSLFTWASPYVAALIAVISLLITIVFIIVNLTTIYSCYAGICMPEEKDQNEKKDTSSDKKESFISAYKRQKAEREEAARERAAKKQKNDEKGK